MPNWVYNRVHGSKKICEALLNKDRLPTFTNIIPTPKELNVIKGDDESFLKALGCSIFENNNKALKDLYAQYKPDNSFEQWMKVKLLHNSIDSAIATHELEAQYGVTNWYDFNCKYYGCKWDARSIDGDPYGPDVEEIEFETPWSPPEGVMNEIAKLYPDEKFIWHCDEESCMFSFDAIYNGDGMYHEEDVFPEYYTPYIMDENELVDETNGITDVNTLKESIESLLPENCYYEYTEDKDKKELKIAVFDWSQLGGDLLYEHTFEGVQYN